MKSKLGQECENYGYKDKSTTIKPSNNDTKYLIGMIVLGVATIISMFLAQSMMAPAGYIVSFGCAIGVLILLCKYNGWLGFSNYDTELAFYTKCDNYFGAYDEYTRIKADVADMNTNLDQKDFDFLDKLKNDPDYMGDDMWSDIAELINKEKHLDKPCFNKKAGKNRDCFGRGTCVETKNNTDYECKCNDIQFKGKDCNTPNLNYWNGLVENDTKSCTDIDGKKNYKVSIKEEGCKKVDKKFIEVIDSNECVDPKYCHATCKGVSHQWCHNGIHKREDGDDHSNDDLTPQCIYDKNIYKCRHRIDIKETKCNDHDRKHKCNKHNHCKWNNRDDICEYKDKCKNLGRHKCRNRNDCKWDNGDCVKKDKVHPSPTPTPSPSPPACKHPGEQCGESKPCCQGSCTNSICQSERITATFKKKSPPPPTPPPPPPPPSPPPADKNGGFTVGGQSNQDSFVVGGFATI